MFCKKCGAENTDDSRFCDKCGNSLAPAAKKPEKALSGAAGSKKNILIICGAFVIAAAIILTSALRSGKSADTVPSLQKSDIVGKWYTETGVSRTVYCFAEDGRAWTWDEMSDFYDYDETEGLLGGTWKIIGRDGIKITYDTDKKTVFEQRFGESGLGGVVLYEDGKQVKFLVNGDMCDGITMKRYPDV